MDISFYIFGIIALVFILICIFLSFVPVGLWISALASGVHVSWGTLIGMKIRRIQPKRLVYPLIRLGACVFGHFDPDEFSPIEAMASCRLPVLFFHGDADDFVPHEMSLENYEACIAPKRLVITPGAGHGLCFPVAPEPYKAAMREFLEPFLEK